MSRDSIRTEGVQPMKKEQDLTEETTAGQEPEEAAKAAEPEVAAAQEAESASQPEQAEQLEIKQTRTEPDPAEQLAAEKDKYLRLYAEYDNYRKRTAKEKTETYSHATAAAVETLLPALDSFSLALEAACTDEAYKTGMEKIYTQLNEALKKLGVREMEALGTPFDPNFHHAIKQAADTEYEEGMVCQVFQKGYLIGDRVIRHAMVAVAQ